MKLFLIVMRALFGTALFLFSSTGHSAAPELLAVSQEVFAHPHDLELGPDGQWLYVSDVNNHEIKVLNPATLEIVNVIGRGELNSPHDVHFNDQGHMLVADSGNDRIAIYQLDGVKATFINELSEEMSSPEGVTSAAEGLVFVASTGNHRILKFRNNKLVKKVGGRGDGKLEFVRPHDIEMGPDGLLYIGDPGNSRIQILSEMLRFKDKLQIRSKPFDEPKYLALDQHNRLYVADQHNNMLRIFDMNRLEIESIARAGDKNLNYIEGVEVRGDQIWISDTYNDRIVLYRWTP